MGDAAAVEALNAVPPSPSGQENGGANPQAPATITEVAPPPEPAPEPTSPPASATTGVEEGGAGAEEEEGQETSVPYSRFREVNEEAKDLRRQLDESNRYAEERSRVLARQQLEQIQRSMPPQAPQQQVDPKDPLARLDAIERQNQWLVQEAQRQRLEMETERTRQAIVTMVDKEMDKYPVINNSAESRNLAELYTAELLRQPNISPERAVQMAASKLRGFVEEIKTQYITNKVQVKKTVPATISSAGPKGSPVLGKAQKPTSMDEAELNLTARLAGKLENK